MTEFTPVSGFVGGLLIGAASVLLLWTIGRIAGISGILGGVVDAGTADMAWRLAFLVGLVLGPLVTAAAMGRAVSISLTASVPLLFAAGLMVGVGTRLGSGCTSGHGVCGIARLSPRSIAATAVFIVTAGLTVFVVRHVIGG
jgi:uncharacterized membrane protein YedE/YeeE